MARFERSGVAQGPVVQGFSDRGFSVDGGIYRALLLSPERADAWDAPNIEALTEQSLGDLMALEPSPEFLILGTGATTRFPPRSLVAALEKRGIGVEAMDSRAAARTWGLLRSEERWIVAALMPLA
jgi:uncharacterized protein